MLHYIKVKDFCEAGRLYLRLSTLPEEKVVVNLMYFLVWIKCFVWTECRFSKLLLHLFKQRIMRRIKPQKPCIGLEIILAAELNGFSLIIIIVIIIITITIITNIIVF